MSDELENRLQEIQARVEAATPVEHWMKALQFEPLIDYDFIAHSRADIEFLLASLRARPQEPGLVREIREVCQPLVGQLLPASHLAERILQILSAPSGPLSDPEGVIDDDHYTYPDYHDQDRSVALSDEPRELEELAWVEVTRNGDKVLGRWHAISRPWEIVEDTNHKYGLFARDVNYGGRECWLFYPWTDTFEECANIAASLQSVLDGRPLWTRERDS